VTATREKLLDMAENFEAMGWTSEAADARLAASKLAPPAPDDARQIAVGDRVRVVAIENGAPDSRVGMVGLIDEITDYDASHRVKFEDGEVWYFQPSELAAVRASSGAPRIDAPDDAPRFKVGDDVIVSLDENDRERGKVAATCANGYGVDFADGHRTWCAPSQLTLAPPADAPDNEGLSEADAAWLEDLARREGLGVARAIASRIRTTLANGAGDSDLRGRLSGWREWSRAALGISPEPDATLRGLLDDRLANGAGEVERLRAELADARRYLAETERTLEKKRGAFNFECSLRSTAERARLDAEKERDALRAELDEARREAGPAITRADAGELLEMSDLSTSDACYQRVRAALRAYAGGGFECCHPNPLDAATARAEKAEAECGELRAELDEARRERHRDLAALGEWRTWASDHGRECLMSDGANRAAIDRMLGEARRERDEALSKLGEVGVKLDFARADLDDARRALGQRDGKIVALESKLAAAKAGPAVFQEDVRTVVGAACDLERTGRNTRKLRDLADRLEAFIQARGETGVGK
jgi:hypothetical protein